MDKLAVLSHRYVSDRRKRGEICKATAQNITSHLASFLPAHGDRPLDQLGRATMERWLERMEADGVAQSTRSVRLSSVRAFAEWCVLNRHVQRDWTVGTARIRRSRQVSRDLTAAHFAGILETVAGDSRLTVMVWLMFGSGLRCVEVSRLSMDDIDRVQRFLFVTGKGGHQRHAPMPEPVLSAVDRYVQWSRGPLVRPVDAQSRHLAPSTISHAVSKAIDEAGLKIRRYDGRSAHGLRAAAASDLYDLCSDPRLVQHFLGHRNIATVQPYLRRAEDEQVRAAVERRFAA